MIKNLEQEIAAQALSAAIEENKRNIECAGDSDAGDKIAFALEVLSEATDFTPLPDELLVYDTNRSEFRIVRHSALTLQDLESINEGKYLPVKGLPEYEKLIERTFACEDNPFGEMPMAFNSDGSPSNAFDYEPPVFTQSHSPEYGYLAEDLPNSCNYYHHIDLTNDTHNGHVIKKYFNKNISGYIYSLVISLAAVNLEFDDEIDKVFIAKHFRRILRDKLDLTAEEYENMYMKDVYKAICNVEHLLFALRYKQLPPEGLEFSPIPYGDSTYTIFANIFGNSIFNPYANEESTAYDFLSIIG